jgi:uncharacterized protein (TIGR04255 family)
MSKPMATYLRPPIVEAVIEVQFTDEPLPKKEMERFVKKIKRKYERSELMLDYSFGVSFSNGVASGAEPKLQSEWFRCVGKDAADILNIRPTSLVTARTAPYNSWESLFDSFKEYFETLRKTTRFKKATRVGARYINRIDVPSPQSAPIDIRRYLHIYPHLPFASYPTTTRNFASLQFRELDNVNVIIQAGLADPALINHTSLLLDIDVFIFDDIPLKPDLVFSLYDKLRAAKNRLFEALITEDGRSLFDD